MHRAADVMSAWRAARHELREALTAYDEMVRRERRAAVLRAAGPSASSGQPDVVQRRAADRIRFEMGEIDRLAVLRLGIVAGY